MKLAYRKSTNEPINDFQQDATEEGLIGNAIRAGIPANDIEVRNVTQEVFDFENQKIIDSGEAARKAEEKRIKDLKTSIKQKLKAIDFTDEELSFFLNE